MRPKTVSALVLSTLSLLIMLQNTQTVTVRLLFWKILLPQILLIFLMLLFGLLIGYLIGTLKSGERRH